MISRKFFSVTAALALFLCFAQTNIFAKDEWIKIQSKNFQMFGDAGEGEIRRAAMRLEQFREIFRQIFPQARFDSPVPTKVVVFKNEKSFDDFKPLDADGKRADWVAGYFQSGEDANYIALSVEGERRETYRTIFHEYVHFLVDNELGMSNVPPWLNEGLAEFYERLSIEDERKVTLGAVDGDNLRLLRENKLIALEAFFNTDYYSLAQQGNDGAGLYYAQAWALTHYLMLGGGGARNAQLAKFVNLLLSGKAHKAAFNEAFETDYAAMEKELKNYVEQRSFPSQIVTLKNKLNFDADLKISLVSEAEAESVLGDLLLHTRRFDEAEAHLKKALALDPNSSAANVSLGLVKVAQDDLPEAEKLLEKAVRLDEKNYLAQYEYAFVLSRDGMTDFGFVSDYEKPRAEKMKAALKKAVALNPNFAPSYDLFAFICAVRNEDIDRAIEFLQKALIIAPGNQDYLIRQAELYLRKEDFSKARKIAQRVFQNASDKEMKVYARNTLERINSTEAQLEALKNYKPRPNAPYVTDKPLSEAELARLRAQALLEALNETLRRPRAGEKRVLGFLSKIDCAASGMIYTAKIENELIKLHSESFDTVTMMSFDGNMADKQIGCGALKTESFAVLTYRPNAAAKTSHAGEIVSIEFVPKTFRFLY